MSAFVILPKRIVEELERRGLDVEDAILSVLFRELNLDPEVVADAHLELAERYLAEGRELVDRDPVQASEKLYKAVEECVKALAIHHNLEEILRRVEKRGRWTVTDLENAVEAISEKLGEWIIASWGEANYLHIWGFHEAKLDSKAVKLRLHYIERAIEETKRLIALK
ncbi:MAG: PaREP1 family protein [Desulfurococcales archaeon]|nr:PaREP1 family protein [Desulfurococcales archaeon]